MSAEIPKDFQQNKPHFNPPSTEPCSVLDLVFKGDQNLIAIYKDVVNYNNMEIIYDTDFHPRAAKQCYDLISAQGPTMTFFFSDTACCGGYLSQSWVNPEHDSKVIEDEEAFLFSLVHPNKAYPQTQFPCIATKNAAIAHSLRQSNFDGPGFGYSGSLLGLLFYVNGPTGLSGISNYGATHAYALPKVPKEGLLGPSYEAVPINRCVICALNDKSDTVAMQIPLSGSVDILEGLFSKRTALKIYKKMVGITKLVPLFDSNVDEKTNKNFFSKVSNKGPVVIIMKFHDNSYFGAVTSVPIPPLTTKAVHVTDPKMVCFAFGPKEYFYPGMHPIDPKNAENAMFLPTSRDPTMGLGIGKNGGTALVKFPQKPSELPVLNGNIHGDKTFLFNTKLFGGFTETMKIVRYFVGGYNPADKTDIPPEPTPGEEDLRIAKMIFKGNTKLACIFNEVVKIPNLSLIYDSEVKFTNRISADKASEEYRKIVHPVKPTLFVIFGATFIYGVVTYLSWPECDRKTEEVDPNGFAFTIVHPSFPPSRFPLRRDVKGSITGYGYMRNGPRFGTFGEFCAVTFTSNYEQHPKGLYGVAHNSFPRDLYKLPRMVKTLIGAPPGEYCTSIDRFVVCTFPV